MTAQERIDGHAHARLAASVFGGGEDAAEMVYRTGLAESGYRTRRQHGGGPARGWWQMEPATERDIWTNWIAHRPEIAAKIVEVTGKEGPGHLEDDDLYAAIMCRLHYRRVPEALPDRDDLAKQAAYWKRYYNTAEGRGTVQHFIESFVHDA